MRKKGVLRTGREIRDDIDKQRDERTRELIEHEKWLEIRRKRRKDRVRRRNMALNNTPDNEPDNTPDNEPDKPAMIEPIEPIEPIENIENVIKEDKKEIENIKDEQLNQVGNIKRGIGKRGKADQKTKMLREFKRIWQDNKKKVSDRVSAAQLYADLMGWRLKKDSEMLGDKNVMNIQFKRAMKEIKEPPEDKMIEPKSVETKIIVVSDTTTTTTPILPSENIFNER